MTTRTYAVEITGRTPLLMHNDDVEWSDAMETWKNDPANKKGSKAGDDRSPAFRWIGGLYFDGNVVCIPSNNLSRCFMEGGAMVLVPGGKSGKTFKAQTQSGMVTGEADWPLIVGGKSIPRAPLAALQNEPDFSKHKQACADLGFMLFIKRAKIGTSKHIRVRARFDDWKISGTINVWDDQITETVLRDILECAGKYKGLCDWRPGGRTPGSFGMFSSTVTLIK